jgi:hypothetical protein
VSLDVDSGGLVFTRRRHCFSLNSSKKEEEEEEEQQEQEWLVDYQFRCSAGDPWRSGQLVLVQRMTRVLFCAFYI